MGIPVVDLTSSVSFAKSNPLAAGLIALAFVVSAIGIYWVARKYPQLWRKIGFVLLLAYVALLVFVGSEMFKPRPSPVMQVFEVLQETERLSIEKAERE